MTSYFDVLSWTRARKNREALEKTNPQNPVLNEEDETFLQRITSQEAPAPPLPVIEPTVIDDEGVETEASATQKEAAEMILPSSPEEKNGHEDEKKVEEEVKENEGQHKRTWASYIPSVPLPSLKSRKVDTKVEHQDEKKETEDQTKAEKEEEQEEVKTEEQKPDNEVKEEEKASETETKIEKNRSDSATDKIEQAAKEEQASDQQPAQEAKDKEAESTTDKAEAARETIQKAKDGLGADTEDSAPAFEAVADKEAQVEVEDSTKSTTESNADEPIGDSKSAGTESEQAEEKSSDASKEKETEKTESTQRTWASYIPAMPSLGRGAKGKEPEKEGEEAAAAIAAETQTAEAKEQDEREVSVLLDRLNLSAINNRVFSFSEHSQKIYGQFTLILRDMVDGAPTAYEDLENLIKDNEKHLDQMFSNMPPFVQTLVKSLPAKFASSLGPEIMAAASDSPGNDLKKRMEVASKASASSAAGPNINFETKKKQKKKVPGVKALAKEKGAVTSMLTNIVNFLKVRFPAFVTGTNIVMSLAVFILLFVFWYCHKRGKETRLLRESESARASAVVSEASDNEEEEEVDEKPKDKATSSSASEAEDNENAEADDDEKVEVDKIEEAGDKKTDVSSGGQKLNVGGPDNASAARAKKILEQSSPANVPLPEKGNEA